jgi:FG-GAP-like repeat
MDLVRQSAASVALLTFSAAGMSGERLRPRFDRAVALETVAETTANASLGDVDGDGHLDIVLAKGRHWPLLDVVLINDGKAGFTRRHVLADRADRSYSAALADLAGDGDLDLVVANDAPDQKVVYFNDGRGHFTLSGTFGAATWPTRNVTVVDAVLSPDSATSIAAGDLDGDGAPDLAVPHRDGGQSYVYINDRRGRFARRRPFGPPRSATRAIALGDLDGDGRLDIVVGDEIRGSATIYFNRGDRFSDPVAVGEKADNPYAIAVADLDGDGRLDVVLGNEKTPGALLLNESQGTAFTVIRFGDGRGAVYGLTAGDVNEDGWPDIVAARSGAPSMLYLNSLPPRPRRGP